MSIYQKILKVQQEVDNIPKSGYNSFNKYNYCTEADVLAIKALMNTHGLIAYPSVESFQTYNRADSFGIIQHIEYTVVDVETGESITVKVMGQGEDKGDKGSYKASTGANKYFYLKFAGAPTGDDPERDEQPQKPPNPGKEPGKRGYNADGRYSKNSGVDVTKLQVGEHSTPGGYKNDIIQLKEQNALEWSDITEITGLPSVLKCQDIEELKAAKTNLESYLEHFQKTG